MTVMLHDWIEFFGYHIFQKFNFNDAFLHSENILEKCIKTITITKIISFGGDAFVLSILLSQEMVSKFIKRYQTLHKCIQIAIIVNVSNSYYPISESNKIFMNLLAIFILDNIIIIFILINTLVIISVV